jgi:hypothetical protein
VYSSIDTVHINQISIDKAQMYKIEVCEEDLSSAPGEFIRNISLSPGLPLPRKDAEYTLWLLSCAASDFQFDGFL